MLRVVSSAFGTGADWEQEFFDDMEKGWRPYFENLRLYLSNFPGQQVTSLTAHATIERPRDDVWAAIRRDLGAEAAGQSVAAHGIAGTVERIGTPPAMSELLIRALRAGAGLSPVRAHGPDEGPAMTIITGYLFSDDAPGYVERETPAWKAWLEGLAVPTS